MSIDIDILVKSDLDRFAEKLKAGRDDSFDIGRLVDECVHFSVEIEDSQVDMVNLVTKHLDAVTELTSLMRELCYDLYIQCTSEELAKIVEEHAEGISIEADIFWHPILQFLQARYKSDEIVYLAIKEF